MGGFAKYVLVTPTKDEERTIGETISSVVAQNILPEEWVIVSDGSTDGTDACVQTAQKAHPWIRLIRLAPRSGRCFGAVARATNLAIQNISTRDYTHIGLLDSDLRFGPEYFESVIREFEANPKLGLAGGWVLDSNENRKFTPDNTFDVPGAAQFFRRDCFESLGEIYAIPEGGWDMLTCAKSRMNGFETTLLTHLTIDHLKPRNVAEGSGFRRGWQLGVRDYALGYHPLFEIIKCLRRVTERPLIVAAVLRLLGYLSAAILRKKRYIPPHLLAHIRGEQLLRLKHLLSYRANNLR